MIYSNDMQWADWSFAINRLVNTSTVNNLIAMVEQGKAIYDKWAALIYGLTDAQIQALPQFTSRTVEDITAMRFAVGVFKTVSDALASQQAYLIPFE